jgi:hypothetical protein
MSKLYKDENECYFGLFLHLFLHGLYYIVYCLLTNVMYFRFCEQMYFISSLAVLKKDNVLYK